MLRQPPIGGELTIGGAHGGQACCPRQLDAIGLAIGKLVSQLSTNGIGKLVSQLDELLASPLFERMLQ